MLAWLFLRNLIFVKSHRGGVTPAALPEVLKNRFPGSVAQNLRYDSIWNDQPLTNSLKTSCAMR